MALVSTIPVDACNIVPEAIIVLSQRENKRVYGNISRQDSWRVASRQPRGHSCQGVRQCGEGNIVLWPSLETGPKVPGGDFVLSLMIPCTYRPRACQCAVPVHGESSLSTSVLARLTGRSRWRRRRRADCIKAHGPLLCPLLPHIIRLLPHGEREGAAPSAAAAVRASAVHAYY